MFVARKKWQENKRHKIRAQGCQCLLSELAYWNPAERKKLPYNFIYTDSKSILGIQGSIKLFTPSEKSNNCKRRIKFRMDIFKQSCGD